MSRTYVLFVVCALASFPCMNARSQDKAPAKGDTSAEAKANNELAFDLYRQLAKEAKPDDNIFFSPYSIRAALAMTYAGAGGELADEMAKVLRFDRDQNKFHHKFADFSRQLLAPAKDAKTKLVINNCVWLDQKAPVLEAYREIIDKHYCGAFRRLDFENAPEPSRKEINAWVARQTEELIQELLPEDSIKKVTRYVLTNATYFKDQWHYRFDPKQTKQDKFIVGAGRELDVPMMRTAANIRYHRNDIVALVQLPFAGNRYSMIMVLPVGRSTLADVEEKLMQWPDWMEKGREVAGAEVLLPKCDIKENSALKPVLSKLGMQSLFVDPANLYGVSGIPLAFGGIYHESRLKLDEQGAEAAAATGVVVNLAMSTNRDRFVFAFNRPGLIAIRRNQDGCVVFMGRLVVPTNAK